MTSMKAAPWCAIAAFTRGMSCCLSPEKLRATKVAPMMSASDTVSTGASAFTCPRFAFEPLSAVGEVRAGERRGHAAVHRVEAVRVAEEIVGRLRRAADAGELGDLVRLDVELPEGLDKRRRDRVVAAAGAQRRDLAFVVAAGVADLVLWEGRVVELGFGEISHPYPLTLALSPKGERE